MSTHLVQMANDIAMAHHSYDEDDGIQMVSDHINKFWAPPMRQKLFEAFQEEPGAFDDLVAKSLPRINCARYNPHTEVIHDKEGTGG